jgi:hypothetical protein
MARSKARSRSTSRGIVVRPMAVPSMARPIILRVPSGLAKAKKAARRIGARGGKRSERQRVGAVAGAFILGMVDKSGWAIPELPFIGRAGTLGLVAWGIHKGTNSGWADDVATGMFCVAAYELAREGKIEGSGEDDVRGL